MQNIWFHINLPPYFGSGMGHCSYKFRQCKA